MTHEKKTSENDQATSRNHEIHELYTRRLDRMDRSEMVSYLADLRTDALIDERTGLGSNKAFIFRNEKSFIASIDVDSLKWVNDNLGHKAGDQLLNLVGQSLKVAGLKNDSYHVSGDEFFSQSNDLTHLTKSVSRAQDWLSNQEIAGEGLTYKAPGFSFGAAETISKSDGLLIKNKLEREELGLRASRGEEPEGVKNTPLKSDNETLTVRNFLNSIDEYDNSTNKTTNSISITEALTIGHDNNLVSEQRDHELRDIYTKRAELLSDSELHEYFSELRTAALTSDTGLGSNKAFMIRDETKYIASIDVDSLKWINDNLSHTKGDELLHLTAKALTQAGLKSSSYHISGDEFFVTSNDTEDLNDKLLFAQEWMSNQVISDKKWTINSPGFSFGVSNSINEADNNMQNDKYMREEAGERSGRGEVPPLSVIQIKSNSLNIIEAADLKLYRSSHKLSNLVVEVFDKESGQTNSVLFINEPALEALDAQDNGFFINKGPQKNEWVDNGTLLNLDTGMVEKDPDIVLQLNRNLNLQENKAVLYTYSPSEPL